jgi:diadenosine tetraphosphate (Ap4A) HIT family hydrolase
VPACPFCSPRTENVIASTSLVLTLLDAFPASPGHTLVVPRRHVESAFDLTEPELREILDAVRAAKASIDEKHHPDGYNVGFNVGTAAGQTVMHAHVHIIPRYSGDVPNPRGGVRHAVMGKGYY